eukprot:12831909-Alexandrium_andersonii.AAC.1
MALAQHTGVCALMHADDERHTRTHVRHRRLSVLSSTVDKGRNAGIIVIVCACVCSSLARIIIRIYGIAPALALALIVTY